MSRIYSSRKVGKLLGADPSSVNRWIDSGKLDAYRTPGGHRRVPHENLMAFLERCRMPIPDELKPQQLTVMMVDRDRQLMRALRRSLVRARRGIQVEPYTSWHQALVLIGLQRPDVVLWNMDLCPDDVADVCQSVKAIPETGGTLLVLHGQAPAAPLKKRLRSLGAAAVLTRPFKGGDVLELLEEE